MSAFNEEKIKKILTHIQQLLPIQAPLPSFVHNNILQAFEHLPFEEGVFKAQEIYHAKAFMDEDFYLQAIEDGRITVDDLIFVLKRKIHAQALNTPTPFHQKSALDLFLNLLLAPPKFLPQINIQWLVGHESDQEVLNHKADKIHIKEMEKKLQEYFTALGFHKMQELMSPWLSSHHLTETQREYFEKLFSAGENYREMIETNPHRFMFTVLWAFCIYHLEKTPKNFISHKEKIKSLRFRNYIIENYAENYDDFLNPFIIRMLSSYMDQGLSYWPSPLKEAGLWKHFEAYFLSSARILPPYYESAKQAIAEYNNKGLSFLEIIQSELEKTPYTEHKWQSYLTELMMDLRGWAGMIQKLDKEPHLAPVKSPKLNLEEFTAIRLILERSSVEYYLKKHHLHFNDRSLLTAKRSPYSVYENAFLFLETILSFELGAEEIFQMKEMHLNYTAEFLLEFAEEKRQVFYHNAFEHHLIAKTIHTLKIASKRTLPKPPAQFQILHCMDDREEALRRYLEEIDPSIETFGTLGFFGVDMNYVKINHPRKIPQCPVVIKPRKVVREVPKPEFKSLYQKAQKATINVGRAQLMNYYSGRTLIRGLFSTLFLGIPSLIPLSLRILSPSKAKKLDDYFAHFFITHIDTDIAIHKKDYTEEQSDLGYSYEEMRDIVLVILKGAGLTKNFAKIIVSLGHGSSSVNNAHIMAYGCGACGGNPGSPNARAFAKMANMKEVRELIRETGINIPDDTYFIGGFHNTCSDEVTYHDVDKIPATHTDDFKKLSSIMQKALELNAYERVRWFKNVPLKLTPLIALNHVKSRSLSLAEPRPEYGHSNVSLAVIGRRELTKGLFLDRRVFLVSYEPSIDHDGSILQGLLNGSVPVGAGISLDYFFSHIDSDRYGCGSKLPLNLSSMIGVISGASSDLRLGLPKQAVDIHEPVRLTVLIEAENELLLQLVSQSPRQLNLIKNEWLFVFSIHPTTKEIFQFLNGKFVPYQDPLDTIIKTVNSSHDYVVNKKGALEFVFTQNGVGNA